MYKGIIIIKRLKQGPFGFTEYKIKKVLNISKRMLVLIVALWLSKSCWKIADFYSVNSPKKLK